MKTFLYSSYKDIGNSDSALTGFIDKYYSKNQASKQYRAYKKLIHKTYKDKEEIGFDIEELCKVSGYRMKLLRLNNKNNITFVCSNPSKKKTENGEEATEEKDSKAACKNRIRFEVNCSDISFKSLKVHNHAPTEVEEEYLNKSKNIKFPLPIISLIVRGIYYSYIYNNCVIKKCNLGQLEEEIKGIAKNGESKNGESNSDFIYNRKVPQFLESLIKQLNKEKIIKSNSKSDSQRKIHEANDSLFKSEFFELILTVILRMGADYLRLDSLIHLERIIEMGIFKNCYTPETALVVFMNENYYDSKINTEILHKYN